ncbi:MAG: molybdopterin-guanine dinucleotide biosynthesis protein B [Mariprofundaceae bacterium]|nr:molybdopterin-guanine dinucleotide biosynthesis protein B [Mariprofundaceae bacterium]
MNPPVVAFVGRSGAGKTTLLVKVIAELHGRGINVGSIKHSHHITAAAMDAEGKDSWRHKQAGAERTLLVGKERLQLISDSPDQLSPAELANRYMDGMQLVLAEGYKESPGDKIEVVRAERANSSLLSPEDGLIALASDIQMNVNVPHFELDDPVPIVDFLVARYLS